MNLINDAWIPARRKSGIKEKIAPWQVTVGYDTNPIIELVSIRPDFNGALIQFLIGLLQTTCAPQGNSDWRKWLNNPPKPEELKAKFEDVADAFNLDGTGPRFMQDLTIENEKDYKVWSVSKLLPGFPGIATAKDNTALFIKKNTVEKICLHCAAISIFLTQSYARSGGSGWRQGLRGSNPATIIIKSGDLWKTVWTNVIGKDIFCNLGNIDKTKRADKFPWMAKTKTSDNNEQVVSIDVHPSQIFWQMPWRIKVILEQESSSCDVCGELSVDGIIKNFFAKNHGINYEGIWKHPLTAYKFPENDPQNIRPINITEGGLGYKYWMGIVFASNLSQPSLNIQEYLNRKYETGMEKLPLWVFGYDMKKDKARCWYEGVMPVIFIDDEEKWEKYCAYVAMIINAAETVSGHLSKAVVKAQNAGVFNSVRQRFWQETESEFYSQLENLRQDVLNNGEGIVVRQAWYKYLKRKASSIFNDMSQAEMIDMVNAERVAKAYNELSKNMNGRRLKIDILGLP